jgi:hypothetical protein
VEQLRAVIRVSQIGGGTTVPSPLAERLHEALERMYAEEGERPEDDTKR